MSIINPALYTLQGFVKRYRVHPEDSVDTGKSFKIIDCAVQDLNGTFKFIHDSTWFNYNTKVYAVKTNDLLVFSYILSSQLSDSIYVAPYNQSLSSAVCFAITDIARYIPIKE